MTSTTIDFGIVNYKGGISLTECVRSILALRGVNVRVFVCDNGSDDSSLTLLRDSGLECQVDETGYNLGYAGACNRLLERMNAPVQVLCNMDLQFDPDWAVAVLELLERRPECGSVASLVLEPGNIVNAMGVLFHPDLHAVNEASGISLEQLPKPEEKKVFGCYGAVMAFRREVVQKTGPLDESFFLFFEETEWYIRQNLHGFTTWFCPAARVYHERSRTTVRYSALKLYYAERNRVRCALRYLPWTALCFLPCKSFLRYLEMARGGIPSQDASGKRNPKWKLILTLLQAWCAAIACLGSEFKKATALRRTVGKDYRKRAWNLVRLYSVKTQSS